MIVIVRRNAVIILMIFFCGCQTPQYSTSWSQIELGMSRGQVKTLLGEPTSVMAAQKLEEDNITVKGIESETGKEVGKIIGQVILQWFFDRGYERWTYGDAGFIGPPTKAFCVYFDENGRVLGYRQPTEGRYTGKFKPDVIPQNNSPLESHLKSITDTEECETEKTER